MKHLHRMTPAGAALLAIVTLAAGCAGAPPAPPTSIAASAAAPLPAPRDCTQLHAEIAGAKARQREALDKQQDAWKVVVPFAVAARYASAMSAVDDAGKRLAELNAESARQGCVRHGD